MGYDNIIFEICKDRCIDYIKSQAKGQLEFLAHDDIFVCIMVKKFRINWTNYNVKNKENASKKKEMDTKSLKQAFYTSLNYYMDRVDVAEDMKENIKNILDYEKILSYGSKSISCYEDKKFKYLDKSMYTDDQLKQICLGIAAGVDIFLLLNPAYTPSQMYQILLGQARGISAEKVKVYCDPKYPDYLMLIIQNAILANVSPKPFLNTDLSAEEAQELLNKKIKDKLFYSNQYSYFNCNRTEHINFD